MKEGRTEEEEAEGKERITLKKRKTGS